MLGNSGGGLIKNSRMPDETQQLPSVQAAPAAQEQPVQATTAMEPTTPGAQPGAVDAGGLNDVMNNSLRLLHDPEASQQFEQMIAQGEDGAAQAAVLIGEQVVQAHAQNGAQIDPDMAAEAIEVVVDDITQIGIGNGSLAAEPVINGEPASKMAIFTKAAEMWAEKNPEFAASLAEAAQQGTPEDDAAAQQLAQYVGGGANANQG